MHEVIDGTTFREELRVVENLELGVGTVKLELFTRGERQYTIDGSVGRKMNE